MDHVICNDLVIYAVSLTSRDQTGGVSVVDSSDVTTAQALLNDHDELPDGYVNITLRLSYTTTVF